MKEKNDLNKKLKREMPSVKFSDIADSVTKYEEIELKLKTKMAKFGIDSSIILRDMLEEPKYYLFGKTMGNIEVIVLMEAYSRIIGYKLVVINKIIKCLISPSNSQDPEHIQKMYKELENLPDKIDQENI